LSHLGERLVQDAKVVLAQPLAELSVRYADAERGPIEGEKGGRPEPCGKAVAVDLALDAREDSSQSESVIERVSSVAIPWRDTLIKPYRSRH